MLKSIKILVLSLVCVNTVNAKVGKISWHAYNTSRNITASRTYPCGSRILVRYKGKSVIVTVKDWGPARRTGRLLDLSRAAYSKLHKIDRTDPGELTVNYRLLSRGKCRIHAH